MKLQRHPDNPILKPNPFNEWESLNVFNCAVVHHNGLFHMFYRAQGLDYISRIGYAVSTDGVHFNRLQQPILSPQDKWETRGVEDPRVTCLADEERFIMTYTAYSPRGITPMFAQSTNLIAWERMGPLVTEEDNKDHVLFPRRIKGRYVTFHRRPPGMWLAYSDDLQTWTDFQPLMGPREDNWWDCKRIGAGGVPIETEHGWLVIYHAYDHDHVYRLGACLLDLDDPACIIHRPAEPIFEPQEPWELKGDIPNVVFSCANPVVDGTVYVYYGGADRVIGLATAPFDELLDYARYG
ncbi:MAG: glycosidase [Anaerolineae bacterium]|nr:glycosidase [Anaerolineae bacterium]MDH7473648.1 glycosidase [Anaerolineae bacterium]